MTAIKKPVLVKLDRILGYAFFCPHCKVFQCWRKENVQNAVEKSTGKTQRSIKEG